MWIYKYFEKPYIVYLKGFTHAKKIFMFIW